VIGSVEQQQGNVLSLLVLVLKKEAQLHV